MATIKPQTFSNTLIDHWEAINGKLATLADEIPTEQFDYKPRESVRSVAEVVRHVAFWNCYVADRATGKKADDAANELPAEQFPNKKAIICALQESAQESARTLKGQPDGLSTQNLEMLVSFIEHNAEHYGQLVVYARMNNIVPPISRG